MLKCISRVIVLLQAQKLSDTVVRSFQKFLISFFRLSDVVLPFSSNSYFVFEKRLPTTAPIAIPVDNQSTLLRSGTAGA
jgi:hypothetical protein